MVPGAVRLQRLVVSAVTDLVVLIGAMGIPPEIHQTVICRIVVEVTALHTLRARTDERLEDKLVNRPIDILLVRQNDEAHPSKAPARLQDSTPHLTLPFPECHYTV
jgi:hypothetical protein